MKSRYYPGILLSAALLVPAVGPVAQTLISMPHNSGPLTVSLTPPAVCSYVFSDEGGPGGSYGIQSGAGSVLTFMPSAPGNKIVIQFTSFHTEPGFDALFVYDGPNTLAPQIGSGAVALLGLPNPFSGGAGGWQGTTAPYNVAPNTLRASASNTSGALTLAFDSDASVDHSGWTALISEVPGNVCSLQPSGTVNIAAPAGACAADVQIAPPVIVPVACAQALDLRYRLNDGPYVTLSKPAPPAITLAGVPVGLNVVSWQLVEPCAGGPAAAAAQLVSVTDNTPPTLQTPASVVLNLGPGQCTAPFDYTVTASDDCVFAQTSRVDHPVDFNNGAAGVMFDVKNISASPILVTEFGPALDAGNWPLEVYVTTSAPGWQGVENTPAAWTLAGARLAVSAGPQSGTPVSGFSIALAPGQSRGIYLTSTVGAPVRCTGVSSGVQRQFDDGILQVSCAPGASKGYPFGQTYTSRAYNGYVRCASTSAAPVQTQGLASGAAFPIGATVNVFKATDLSGNTATASFTVTVKAYANPTNTLLCAGTVNASLGPDCATVLEPNDILLGGPYRCYDSYVVHLDKIPPYTDGPWVPAVLTSADLGKTYGVRVTDPVNNNFCQGSVLVEDKLPPVLTGDTVDLPCNFNPSPTYSAPVSVVREFALQTGLPADISDYQTVLLAIPAAAPADALVEDVDVQIRINGDVFEKNLRLELQNPAGASVALWNQATGCSGPLWVRFDDEAPAGADCSQYSGNQHARIPFNGGLLSTFDGATVNGQWKLKVQDLNGFGDLATVTEVKLIVRYKAAFSAGFPNALAFPSQIVQITPTSFSVPAPLLDGCSTVTLSYSDETTTQPCSTGLSAIITRTWTAYDASNNSSKYVQTIRMMRPDFDNVVFPPNYNDIDAPAFECEGPYPTPAWIESQGKRGAPYVFGRPSGCSINWSYTDVVVDVCQGSYTINRNWTLVNACTAQTQQYMQLIQVLDRQGPPLSCPANLTVSTDLYTCCATVNLPDVLVEDACSSIAGLNAKVVVFNQYSNDTVQVSNVGGALTTFPGNNTADPDTLAAFGATTCLPVGTHHVYYRVEDGCGNTKTCSFKISIRDYTPPVAVGQSLTTVSLNADDPNDCYDPNPASGKFAGVTSVPASIFNQGSYDNCSFIKLTVRRQPPYSACIQSLNAVNGGPPCADAFPDLKSEYARAIAESDSIKFYCGEAGATQTLVLRCYQTDALGNYSLGANDQPVFNETQVQVLVQDKLKPGCQAPADLTVTCENFDPALSNYGLPGVLDNCCLDTTKTYHGQAGLTHLLDYTQFDTFCNRGTLTRSFTVFDCQGQSSSCMQRVVVVHDPDYAIRFPDDVVITQCDSTGMYGHPEFFGQGCASIAVSFQDILLTVVPDACYAIERTWHVINWCNYIPGVPCVQVPNPTPSPALNDSTNLKGPIVSPPGMPAPWTATVVKVTPNAAQPTDYSAFWNPSVNCYEYKQIIKIIDTQEPEVEVCPGSPMTIGDQTTNAAELWNETYWYDNSISSHDMADGPSELTITATDLCSNGNLEVRYVLFLDLDGDGSTETAVSSNNLPAYNTVMYGNAPNPNYGGGTARNYDKRPVQPDQKYGFALQTSQSQKKMTAAVRWNTQASPDVYVKPELPYGTHRVRWIVSDGCGNDRVCEYALKVSDTKAPTVVCINGLSVNIMPTKMIQLWASDFLHYAEDNFTPSGQLKFGIRKAGSLLTGFPYLDDGITPQTSVIFTCDDIGKQYVELWAMDAAGNADYCETYVLVQDNAENCKKDSTAVISGLLATESGLGLEAATVTLDGGSHPSLPFSYATVLTGSDGKFAFDLITAVSAFSIITPSKDNDPLNGVSTFDLVLINKHILGLEPLSTPYKMIAADANNSRSITTFDIVELRKLILGIYTDLPNNNSWRFVDKGYTFPNLANPFQDTFPEFIKLIDVGLDASNVDFVAVKVGDVNGNAVTSSLINAEERSGGVLLFDVTRAAPRATAHSVRAGETFTLHFHPAEKTAGYQFTLCFPDLDLLDVLPGPGMHADNFGIFHAEHALTASFDDEQRAGEFSAVFRARAGGDLSRMLNVSGRITRAEAYRVNAGNEKLDVALRFAGENGPVIAAQGFELYQNRPNPWQQRTQIGFYLPLAAPVTLTVFDEAGRTLYVRTGDFAAGYNAFTLDRRVLETPGVLYYQVETAAGSAVKQMVRAK